MRFRSTGTPRSSSAPLLNAARDKRHAGALRRLGWRVITVWECQTEKPEHLLKRLLRILLLC